MLGWVAGWLSGMLEYLVPFLFKKSGTVIFIGLDEAGKSTLLFRLKEGRMTQPVPTQFPTCEGLQIGNVSFKAVDLGGHKQVRRVWKDYYVAADAVVFVVDGSNSARFDEAKEELSGALEDENIEHAPIAILLNKIDRPTCIGKSAFIYKFDLYHKITGTGEIAGSEKEKRPLEVFPVSILKGEGYGQAIKWLAEHMK